MGEGEPIPTRLLGDPGFPPARRLTGKVAVVTGAGSRPVAAGEALVGNGKATAILFAREGARVVLVDERADWAEETQRIVAAEGGQARLVEADAADPEACRRVVGEALEAFGALHVLVNNVGVTGPAGTALEVDPEAWERAMHTNVTSMVLMAKEAVPAMIAAGGGAIVNVASVAGLRGGHPSLLYPTSKAAVIGLTRSMAAHHGREGVRVNCVAPGMVYTPMVAARGMTPALREARRRRSLLQTEGTAWDVAAAVAFLASDQARWITGVVLPVDAGATAGDAEALSPRSDGAPLPGFGTTGG
ncbi:MAG TPA: glucose 1-dehydrogenase [Chloroflexota bacterium]|nr:glucose 1-dehydrogenase [Chloroflexota bacterium]